jgi:hypothetical protein
MANITVNEQNQETSWSYWNSMRKSLSLYLQAGLESVELLTELCATRNTLCTSKKGKQQWETYVKKSLKGNESIEYIEKYLVAFEQNENCVPTVEMVDSVHDQEEDEKESVIFPKEMKPISVEINKDLSPDWNYWESVRKVRKLYLKWSSVSSEILRELYIAKLAITEGGTRTSGVPKKGKKSWKQFVDEAFGGMKSKRTIDAHLLAYVNNGFEKPEKLTVNTVTDHSKVVIKSAVLEDDNRVKVEFYLPKFNTTYFQWFDA